MENNHWESVQGWFDFANIYDFAINRLKDGDVIVELGTWMGKSTCYLAQKIKESNKKIRFYACDKFERPHDSDGDFLRYYPDLTNWIFYDKFIENIRKQDVMGIVTPVMANSLDFVNMFQDKSIDFLFIDDGHYYEHVIKELVAWYPKMKIGGLFTGHDALEPGVKPALEEFKKLKNWDYSINGCSWNSWITIDGGTKVIF